MVMKKRAICHVCGESKKISFEHIPPRCMGNTREAKAYKVAEIVERNRSFNLENRDGIHYQQQQRGIGFQALCPECNNYFGQNYVRSYADCVTELGNIIFSDKPVETCKGILLDAKNIKVLAFIKHVVSNFCTTTQEGSMFDCKDFLLDRDSNAFPERYRLFMFAIPDQSEPFMSSGWMKLLMKEKISETLSLAFLALPPVGFILLDEQSSTAPFDPVQFGCEITSMAQQPWDTSPSFKLSLPYMTVRNSFPELISSNTKMTI